ncbi:MAG: DUF5668 domain-containing protein [Acidobacteriota bacterium]
MTPHPHRVRSLTGPLILIAVGTLFLVHNLTGFNIIRLIGRYWPLILIVVGVVKLWEYFRLNQQPQDR